MKIKTKQTTRTGTETEKWTSHRKGRIGRKRYRKEALVGIKQMGKR